MSFYQGRKSVSSPNDLPPGEHFAIITFGTITIPGDERSRTHPGHGYPESTQSTIECDVYETKENWEAEIIRLSAERYSYKSWVPLIIRRVGIKTAVTMDIG